MELLLASNNLHKLREIQEIFSTIGDLNLNIVTPEMISLNSIDVEEDGATFEENAFKKADYFFQLSSITTIADDSGLEIEALDGLPGVKSARFSGEHGNDAMNRLKVLVQLSNVPEELRKARFKTVICLRQAKSTNYFEGTCSGKIIFFEKGKRGFGYDPIFIPDGHKKTFAEMLPDEKNKISHRGIAIKNLGEFVKNTLIKS